MGVILFQKGPRFAVTIHTPKPSVFPLVGEFSPEPENLPERVEPIRVESEVLPRKLEGTDRLIIARWREPVDEEASVGFTDVEAYIVGDNDISLVEHQVQTPYQSPIVLGAWLVPLEIG